MFTNLIKVSELNSIIHFDNTVVIDCRFSLADTNWGRNEHKAAHIPKANYAHLDEDLSGEIIKGVTGRHPFPLIEDFAPKCSHWGIDAKTQVVAYDQGHGGIAARLWFLLKWLGHEKVAVLDGGWQQWQKAGYPTSTMMHTPSKRTFIPYPNEALLVGPELLEKNLEEHTHLVVDSRSAERYRGENEPIDPIAGHIPNAISAPFLENMSDGTFLPKEQLVEKFDKLLKNKVLEETIFYCGSGVTACHNLLALDYIGKQGAKLYPGSWSDWITDSKRPIAVTKTHP